MSYRPDLLATFEVAVGEDDNQQVFTVHHSVLIERSPFFRAARSDRWTSQTEDLPTKLDDHEVEAFQDYLYCVYKDRVPLVTMNKDANFTRLVKLYILADKVGDLRTSNMVIDEIIRHSDATQAIPSESVLALVYDCTPPKSPLRKLMVDYWTHECPTLLNEDAEKLPEAMLVELAREFAKAIECGEIDRRPTHEQKCRHYHQHGEGEPECEDVRSESDYED